MRKRIPFIIVLFVLLLLTIAPAGALLSFATSCPQTIAKGDTVTITGTGATNGTVTIWIIGRNYFHVSAAFPDKAGNFTETVRPEDTAQFSSGQYAFVIQDPGRDGKPEIVYARDRNGNITFLCGGTVFADVGSVRDIRADAGPVVRTLQSGTVFPGVDDILSAYYFFVEEPSIHFDVKAGADPRDNLTDVAFGERMVISGTTNMGVENPLHADIRDARTNTLIVSKTIPVITGNVTNRWSFDPGTDRLAPGEYIVTVGWMKSAATGTGSTQFSVKKKPGPATVPHDSATKGAGAGGMIPPLAVAGGIALLGISTYAVTRRKRKI